MVKLTVKSGTTEQKPTAPPDLVEINTAALLQSVQERDVYVKKLEDLLKASKTTIAGLEAKLRDNQAFDLDIDDLLKFVATITPADFPSCKSIIDQLQKWGAKSRITEVLRLIEIYKKSLKK